MTNSLPPDISKLKLNEQVQYYERRLNASCRIHQLLSEYENTEKILEQTLQIIGTATHSERVIFRYKGTNSEEGNLLFDQRSVWIDEAVLPESACEEPEDRISDIISTGWGSLLRKQKIIQGLNKDFKPEVREILNSQGIRSVLVVPVINKNVLWGYIRLDRCTEEYRWPKEDIEFVKSVGSNMGSVIEKSRIYVELKSSFRMEKELHDLKNRFITLVSHEIRSPVTAIISSADMIKNHSDKITTDKREQLNDRVIEAADRITSLLNEVLKEDYLSKPEIHEDPDTADLELLVTDLINKLKSNKLGAFEVDLSFSLSGKGIEVDKNLMEPILINLLDNAAVYSEKGSKITIEFKEFGCELNFMIRDEGIGIPENELPRVFEPFFRSDKVLDVEGSGLGLSIVSKAIDTLGGEISIESAVGLGTSVYVSLPLNDN